MQYPESGYVSPPPSNGTFRILSIIMCVMSMVVSVVLIFIVAVIALFQTAWIEKHGGHMGMMNGLVLLSCMMVIAGNIVILLRQKVGLAIYIVGQLIFLYVLSRGIRPGSNDNWDELVTIYALMLTAVTLIACVLHAIFVLSSDR